MKTLFLILAGLFSITAFAQTKPNGHDSVYVHFAHATPAKDILYLLKNDPMSSCLFGVWNRDPKWKGTNPAIVFVDERTMRAIQRPKRGQSVGYVETINHN